MSDKRFSLSDIPLSQSTNDFGTEGYVQGLVRFISHAATPITIALQGEWGSGKTSLMNRLYNELCVDNKKFIGITINTWEYSMLASPEETVLKIITELIHQLSNNDPDASTKIKQYFKGFMNAAYRFGREFTKGVVPGAGMVVEALGVPAELPGSNEQYTVSLSDLKNSLTEAIHTSMAKFKKEGVIIFVDDLDRLNPPLAVQILELLKNIFTLDNCIFVLAIDYEVVVKGLEPKFGKLTENNEREFRSFFDKIIQVPFSLPVNNYKPMNFVLDSLESIGFISHTERKIPYVERQIEKIVVSSVGKNPRSIKRLINTLSLLDCIAQCAKQVDAQNNTIEHKLINFVIVALQVCYPKIYNILALNPNFEKWDEAVAEKLNIHFDKKEGIKEINGEIILDALCEKDVFLNRHHKEILTLFELLNDDVKSIKGADPTKVIKDILDRSSLTSVSAPIEVEEVDRKALIYNLHENVWSYVSAKIPDVKCQFKRNTGNGGFYINLVDDIWYEVIFRPSQNEEHTKIALQIWLNIWNAIPDRLSGADIDAVLADPAIKDVLSDFNETVSRLAQKGIIEGRTYDENVIFNNYIDEIKYRKGELENHNRYSLDVDYWVNLNSAADFEDPTIIRAIGDLVLASYDLNMKAQKIK